MARPIQGTTPLSERVTFRLTVAERQALAKLAGGDVSTYLRRLIMREHRARRKESAP